MKLHDMREVVDRILGQDLDFLSLVDGAPVLPGSVLGEWRIAADEKEVLALYGLPPARADGLMGIVGGFQESGTPTVARDGRRIYILGKLGISTLAVVEGGGDVFSFPQSSEVHPGLKHLYPDGMLPRLVNSSIARFVRCAWLWNALLPLLAEWEKAAGQCELAQARAGKVDLSVDPYESYLALCHHLLGQFREIDSEILEESSFWKDQIIDVW
ncbi:hypothetical protein GCM10022243_02690 [Saccharothrix violaceirubra]|uniref:SUKH-4 immunity protein of toxin-antitoxin system n=1 Tax=Saccharothrix violaceirubra TaxID=413306 RepID=A0A7W7T3S4_9PSEU|nr:SUKH-4 family immunity protein [Saccharothrix violaceirubra]MBB4966028.1 hypothetical protein [Saccharothrix violaceirubra]